MQLLLINNYLYYFTWQGMAMLAASYTDDDERGAAVGLAMGASALGVLGTYKYYTLKIIIFINLYSANYYY